MAVANRRREPDKRYYPTARCPACNDEETGPPRTGWFRRWCERCFGPIPPSVAAETIPVP